MQYPTMTPIETTEIQIFFLKPFESDASQAYALSEIRLLGMQLE